MAMRPVHASVTIFGYKLSLSPGTGLRHGRVGHAAIREALHPGAAAHRRRSRSSSGPSRAIPSLNEKAIMSGAMQLEDSLELRGADPGAAGISAVEEDRHLDRQLDQDQRARHDLRRAVRRRVPHPARLSAPRQLPQRLRQFGCSAWRWARRSACASIARRRSPRGCMRAARARSRRCPPWWPRRR